MKQFSFTIKDISGIHARPATGIVKEARKYKSKIIISANDKSIDATKLIAVMGLGVKCGQKIDIEIQGSDEDIAFENMKSFFEEIL